MDQNNAGSGNIKAEQWAVFDQNLPLVLEKMATPHINRVDSPVKLLPYEPDIYSFQASDIFHVSGSPLDLAVADTISPIAIKGYLKERDRLEQDEKTSAVIGECGNLIKDGQNLVVVTSHADLVDIVTATLLLRDLLLKSRTDISPRSTSMILSKMVSRLKYSVKGFEIPAITVISQFCNDIYLSFPRTDTAKDVLSDLPEACVKNNNELMRRVLVANLQSGGVLLGMAATGTTRIRQDDQTGNKVLAPVTTGTKDIMTNQGNHILLIDINMSDGFKVNKLSHPMRFEPSDNIDGAMADFYFGGSGNKNINKTLGNTALDL